MVIGIGKPPVFAAIIALVGCYQGFQVFGGVDSVGRHTTISVVQSIFLVIVTDAPIDAVATAMRSAAGARDCWIVGGGQVATGFATAGLLDEVIVAVAPVLLGAGTPIITTHLDLTLVSAERNGGLAVLSYRVRRGGSWNDSARNCRSACN